MNESKRIFSTRVGPRATALAVSCLLSCGCTSLQPASSDKPLAPEVAAISRAGRAYPEFADIPPLPTNLRPIKAWGIAARDSESARLALEQATAENTWTLSGTEAFAAKAIRDAGPVRASLASTTLATEAYVRDLRRRATPPPPPRR